MSDERYNKAFSLAGLDELQIIRHAVQFASFLFLNAKFLGLVSTGLIVPYLHSTQAPFSTAVGAYDAFEWTISHSAVPLLVLGVIYLTASTVGRVYCGWACPFGMVQDFLSYLPVRKQRVSAATSTSLSDVKWAIVAFSVLTSLLVGYRRSIYPHEFPAGVFSDSPFSVISPSATLFTYIPWILLWKNNVLITVGMIGWVKMVLLAASLAPSVYIPRFFCRFLCPIGGMMEPLSKYKILRITRAQNMPREDLNRVLADVCPMGVQVEKETATFIDHGGCVHCGKCVTEVPKVLGQGLM